MPKSKEGNKLFVFDTSALFTLFYEESDHVKVASYLQKALKKEVTLLFNEISIGEIYYRTWKDKNKEAADVALSTLFQLPLNFVPVDRAFILASATWKAKYPISYADAFVVETAYRNKCPVITGDPEFETIDEIELVKLVQSVKKKKS